MLQWFSASTYVWKSKGRRSNPGSDEYPLMLSTFNLNTIVANIFCFTLSRQSYTKVFNVLLKIIQGTTVTFKTEKIECRLYCNNRLKFHSDCPICTNVTILNVNKWHDGRTEKYSIFCCNKMYSGITTENEILAQKKEWLNSQYSFKRYSRTCMGKHTNELYKLLCWKTA